MCTKVHVSPSDQNHKYESHGGIQEKSLGFIFIHFFHDIYTLPLGGHRVHYGHGYMLQHTKKKKWFRKYMHGLGVC